MTTAIVLLLVAIGFVIAEVFFPSFGLLGLGALVCCVVAVLSAFEDGNIAGWGFIAAEVIIIPLVVWGAFKVLPYTGVGGRMVLKDPSTELSQASPSLTHLVGRTGVTLTPLRPAGTVDIDGERVSVVGLGGMIDKGARVTVVSAESTEVRVRQVE